MVIFKDMEVLKALDSLKASEILPMASLLLENTVPLLCVCVCVCMCVCWGGGDKSLSLTPSITGSQRLSWFQIQQSPESRI